MTRMSSALFLMALSGCQDKKSTAEDVADDDGDSGVIEPESDIAEASDTGDLEVESDEPGEPDNCALDSQVCAAYSIDWTVAEAEAHCTESGGSSGDCLSGAVGTCELENGLTYYLYAMPAAEAEGYCEWLGGSWSEGDPVEGDS